eukprot:14115421-Alexandrium_andersonii.AAC.1
MTLTLSGPLPSTGVSEELPLEEMRDQSFFRLMLPFSWTSARMRGIPRMCLREFRRHLRASLP